MGAGDLHRLHKQLPKTLKELCGDAVVAPPELMSAGMLADIVFRLGDHRAVLDSVTRAFAHAATENATTTLASISSKAADTTFRRLVQEGVVQPRMSPVDRLFGIVATGDFCMAIALQNWVPQQSEAATELAAMVQHISFLTESGKLNVPAPAKALLQGMAAAADGDDDNDYDSLMRGAARAVAEARDATFKFTEDDGTVNDWQEFVRKTVHMVAKQGHKQFSAVDFSNLTGAIFKFGRLQNSRDLELRAALGQPGGSHRQEVRGAGSVPTVLALNAPHPCSNPACNRGLRAHHAVCFGCRASKGKQWRCSLCGLHTLWEHSSCCYALTGGCPGTRESSREATAAEIASRGSLIVAAHVARAPRGGGGGGGNWGQRVHQIADLGLVSFRPPPESWGPFVQPAANASHPMGN